MNRRRVGTLALLVVAGMGCEGDRKAPAVQALPAPQPVSQEASEVETTADSAPTDSAPDHSARPIDKKAYAPPVPTARDAEGPVLGTTIISDPEVKTIGDLTRLYPLPKDYRYEMAEWGQPIIRRGSDGAVFSFLLEERMLTLDQRRRMNDGRMAADTSEVFHIEDAAKETGHPEWDLENGGRVSGFASGN